MFRPNLTNFCQLWWLPISLALACGTFLFKYCIDKLEKLLDNVVLFYLAHTYTIWVAAGILGLATFYIIIKGMNLVYLYFADRRSQREHQTLMYQRQLGEQLQLADR